MTESSHSYSTENYYPYGKMVELWRGEYKATKPGTNNKNRSIRNNPNRVKTLIIQTGSKISPIRKGNLKNLNQFSRSGIGQGIDHV